MIDDHHAVLFGGVQSDGGEKLTNDTYILDLKIMASSYMYNNTIELVMSKRGH